MENTHPTFLRVARNFVSWSLMEKNFWKHLERIIFVEIFNNNWTTPDTKRKRTLKKEKNISIQFSFHLAYSKLVEAFWFMMIYEEAIKSWFLAPMFWGQFRCCREKYQRKSCALLLHFFFAARFLLLLGKWISSSK